MADEIENKETPNEDLGLGDKVIQENRTRFVNRDGTFNVHRKGVLEHGNFSPYHAVLNASWFRFNSGVLLYYIIANVIFTFLYVVSGRGAFPDIANLTAHQRIGQLFFYSVQIITTLGTSPLHPANTMADVVLSIEAMVGMLGFAVGASLFFARFANPATKILFSGNAVIAPYKNMTGFMVRIINGRNNELIQVTASVALAMNDAQGNRKLFPLTLERQNVATFPLNWTIVHPIDKKSPLFQKTLEDLYAQHAEFVVNITAVDPDLSKTVYARSSYSDGEIVLGKFVDILERDDKGTVVVDPKRIGEIES